MFSYVLVVICFTNLSYYDITIGMQQSKFIKRLKGYSVFFSSLPSVAPVPKISLSERRKVDAACRVLLGSYQWAWRNDSLFFPEAEVSVLLLQHWKLVALLREKLHQRRILRMSPWKRSSWGSCRKILCPKKRQIPPESDEKHSGREDFISDLYLQT